MPTRQTRRSRGTPHARARSTRSARHVTPPPPSSEDEEPPKVTPEESPAQETVNNEDNSSANNQDADEEPEEGSEPSEKLQLQPRKRLGRPPKVRPPGWGTPEPGADGASESGTPAPRGRGRGRGRSGWRGGFRGRARKSMQGLSRATQLPVDDEGNPMEVENDEVVLPEDPEGEQKVDKDGHLLGEREYRVRTFTIAGRGRRLYMLSTEPARCTGFRDSYLFFARHKYLFKIIIDDDEKKDLIDRDILPHSYKGRAIGVVTARSVYREFGSRIVVGGKKITDDYKVDENRARGDIEGELADPYDRLPDKGTEYNRNQYVAWHGASNVYHSSAPNGPQPVGALAGRRKGAITSANWMFEHAREAARFNSTLAASRRQILNGVYDPHTNLMCYPRIMQPTQAVWEEVDDDDAEQRPQKRRRIDGVNGADTGMVNGFHDEPAEKSRLLRPSSFLARNYFVLDTELYTAPHAALPPPDHRLRGLSDKSAEPDPSDIDSITDAGLGPQGLPRVSKQDLAEFSPHVQQAYRKAREKEVLWQHVWNAESACYRPKIGISSMAG